MAKLDNLKARIKRTGYSAEDLGLANHLDELSYLEETSKQFTGLVQELEEYLAEVEEELEEQPFLTPGEESGLDQGDHVIANTDIENEN